MEKASASSRKRNSGGRPEDDLLGQPREMHGDRGTGVEHVEHEVAVGDRVETVGGDGTEAEVGPGRLAVDGVGDPGEGARAQRHDVGTAIGVFEAIEVTVQHGDVGKQMMCQSTGWARCRWV